MPLLSPVRFAIPAALLSALSLAPAAPAQDTIFWRDGTVSRDVRVKEFSLVSIEYNDRGSKEESSDKVLKIRLADFKDEFARAIDGSDPDMMVTQARGLAKRKPLVAQLGFLESARLYLQQGNAGTAFATLKELEEVDARSGLMPQVYQLKIEYYLGKGQFGDARKVAKAYSDEALNGGWPEGFGHDATYRLIFIDDVSGEGDAKDVQTRYRSLLRTVQGAFPRLANQVEVRLAASLQNSGDTEAARKLYDGLLKRGNLDPNTLAGVYLGLGKIAFDEGSPANKEPYREALLWFTRVYVLCRDECWDAYVAEALHFGSEAAGKWGGPDSGYMRGKLRYLLEREYPNSPWAQGR